MSEPLDILVHIAQTEVEPASLTGSTESPEPVTPAAVAEPWVEYTVYGVLVLILLVVFVKAWRTPKAAQLPAPPPEPELEPVVEPEDREALEARARQAFRIPQVLVGDERGGSHARVHMASGAAAPPPTRSETAPPPSVPKPSLQPEAVPEPAAEQKPAPAAERKAVARPSVEAVPAKPEPESGKQAGESIEAAGKTLREGLSRTQAGFVSKLSKLFGSAKAIDDDLLAELEETLFTADIGVRTSQRLVDEVYDALNKRSLQDPSKVWSFIKKRVREILGADAQPLELGRHSPHVIMVVGVNGSGKTTTIGKLANKYSEAGHKVLLAAGDTFRAAAVEQLEVWGERVGVPVVRGRDGQDPASVIFDACAKARDEGYDVCIADTAGRLQAKKELMDELAKVYRVVGKAVPGAPHEVWLVLDSTNGQNAISQAKQFREVVDVTGIVLTKLDGTAKGGVVIGICEEMNLPVRYIGIGEKVEDLREFDPHAFADALFAADA